MISPLEAYLPQHKTKIVCTIGPASSSVETMERMLRAGMSVARLNFSHGDVDSHREVIGKLRAVSRKAGTSITILADLPGPKMRIGTLDPDPVELTTGASFVLTTDEITGNGSRASVSFKGLPRAAQVGTRVFLNDGLIQLEVERVQGADVHCRVVAGGELRSRKGLNIPGINLGIAAFTERDKEFLSFALREGVEAISQSFVESPADIQSVRNVAAAMGHHPFVIAKIERSRALENLEGILQAADGVMIARGDLGVEIPIENIAATQKRIMAAANRLGKPVVTATQMLESMTASRLPTRAEATDVANAILDGTDCVMLSGESAMGKYPVEAVEMLSRIASVTEAQVPRRKLRDAACDHGSGGDAAAADLISLGLDTMLSYASPRFVVVPTRSGATARRISRFKLPVWTVAISPDIQTCRSLAFSYGVFPVHEEVVPDDWNRYVQERLASPQAERPLVFLVEGPSPGRPDANHRLELLDLSVSRGTGR